MTILRQYGTLLSRPWPRLGRSFSSVDTSDVAASEVGSIPLVKQHPRPMFPWRHERRDNVLPRFVPNTREYLMARPYVFSEDALAYMCLGIPFLEVAFFKKTWRKELSENMTFAFTQGLSAIMSNTFHVPVKEVTESVEFTYDPRNTANEVNNDGTRFDNVQYSQMIASPLRELFQSAHESGRDQLRIILETKPIRSHFLWLYGLPGLSKDDFERERALLREIYNADISQAGRKMYDVLFKRMVEKVQDNNVVSGTVAAEVYVICEEKFQVVDTETGVVLQGSEGIPAAQEVGHVVTFEMEAGCCARKDEYPEAKNFVGALPGNWQITDIDDLVRRKEVVPCVILTNE